MKNVLSVLCVICFMFMATMAFANGSHPPLQTAEAQGGGVSQPLNHTVTGSNGIEDSAFNTGYTYHEFDIDAQGTKSAFVYGSGFSTVKPTGFAFQKEINGGELSGAFSKTEGFTTVGGLAIGIDQYERCSHDKFADADIELKAGGTLVQSNRAYSDDRDSYAGGFNESSVEFEAKSWDKTYGNTSFAYQDGLLISGGETLGGSLAWAKQTSKEANVSSFTWNTGSAWERGADRFNVGTVGSGTAYGVAQLPNLGYAQYEASFNYESGNNAYGIAGGTATVQKVGQYGVSSSASSFATVGNVNTSHAPN